MADGTEVRSESSQLFPWYDSVWLNQYASAQAIIKRVKPGALADFVEAFRIFRTQADFEPPLLPRPFDDDTHAEIKKTVGLLQPSDLDLSEALRFGRFVVQDHPFFTELQERTVPIVSDAVGEAVEPAYNILSLYTAKGVCAVHMDSPKAKWTFDLCIEQSAPWPIYFSQVLPWPDLEADSWGADWEEKIKRSSAHRFKAYTLEPGQAVVFSGSSQWHYRDAMPAGTGRSFCNLLFFHFIPKGTAELITPKNWARSFDVPELGQIS